MAKATIKAYSKMYLVPEGVYNRLLSGITNEEKKNIFNLNEMSDQNITENQKPPQPKDNSDPPPNNSDQPPSQDNSDKESQKDNSDSDSSDNLNNSNLSENNDTPVANIRPEDEDNESVSSWADDVGSTSINTSPGSRSDQNEEPDLLDKSTQTDEIIDIYKQLSECRAALARAQAQLGKGKWADRRVSPRGAIQKPIPDCVKKIMLRPLPGIRKSARISEKKSKPLSEWVHGEMEIDTDTNVKRGTKRKWKHECELCLTSFKTVKQLVVHYAKVHDQKYDENTKKMRTDL